MQRFLSKTALDFLGTADIELLNEIPSNIQIGKKNNSSLRKHGAVSCSFTKVSELDSLAKLVTSITLDLFV